VEWANIVVTVPAVPVPLSVVVARKKCALNMDASLK